jgi:enamine deaminase RidA (YjgF/YER057c/UK114 family)
MITFINPSTVHTPRGSYSHLAVVPSGTELVVLSGQVGIRPDGSTPDSTAEQAEQIFANISALLASQGMTADSVVKITVYVVAGKDLQAILPARSRFIGGHRPASTGVYVSALGDPAWHLEVEVLASKPVGAPRDMPQARRYLPT